MPGPAFLNGVIIIMFLRARLIYIYDCVSPT